MTKYTAQYPMMEVHRAGCADLAKSRNVGETRVTSEATDAFAFIASELRGDLEDMGYGAADFRILPCARKAQ